MDELNQGVPAAEQSPDEDVEELSPEELAESNNFVLSALIDLLIKKGVIGNEELQAAMDELERAEANDEDAESDDESDDEPDDEPDGEAAGPEPSTAPSPPTEQRF